LVSEDREFLQMTASVVLSFANVIQGRARLSTAQQPASLYFQFFCGAGCSAAALHGGSKGYEEVVVVVEPKIEVHETSV